MRQFTQFLLHRLKMILKPYQMGMMTPSPLISFFLSLRPLNSIRCDAIMQPKVVYFASLWIHISSLSSVEQLLAICQFLHLLLKWFTISFRSHRSPFVKSSLKFGVNAHECVCVRACIKRSFVSNFTSNSHASFRSKSFRCILHLFDCR